MASEVLVKQVDSDADTLIVQTALNRAAAEYDSPVVVVGTDTSLLVMFVARATHNMNLYMLVNRNHLMLGNRNHLIQCICHTELPSRIVTASTISPCSHRVRHYIRPIIKVNARLLIFCKALNLVRSNDDRFLRGRPPLLPLRMGIP